MTGSKQAKYNKEKTVVVNVRLVKKTEKDILDKLGSVPNKSGYIKSLIRADIAEAKYFDQAVELMDDDIREEIHASGEYDGDKAGFFREYERRHKEKYGEDFSI